MQESYLRVCSHRANQRICLNSFGCHGNASNVRIKMRSCVDPSDKKVMRRWSLEDEDTWEKASCVCVYKMQEGLKSSEIWDFYWDLQETELSLKKGRWWVKERSFQDHWLQTVRWFRRWIFNLINFFSNFFKFLHKFKQLLIRVFLDW